ncbi:unnamed protein product [Gadus morhua 'NCC']
MSSNHSVSDLTGLNSGRTMWETHLRASGYTVSAAGRAVKQDVHIDPHKAGEIDWRKPAMFMSTLSTGRPAYSPSPTSEEALAVTARGGVG